MNSELDSAVSQYLGHDSTKNARPTGQSLSTFKSRGYDFNNRYNSVSSVNSRTSERLLAIEFRLNPSGSDEALDSIDAIDENENSSPLGNNESNSIDDIEEEFDPMYSILEDPSIKEHYYENSVLTGGIAEPIYENLDSSTETLNPNEPMYDTVPRRPQALPKPETLNRNSYSDSSSDSKCSDLVGEDIGDSSELSVDDGTNITSVDKVFTFTPTTDDKIASKADGSETSDLGSSGSEDSTVVDGWSLNDTNDIFCKNNLSNPESALEQLEEEVLAEIKNEKNLLGIKNKNNRNEEYLSIEAVNTSIVDIIQAADRLSEANISDEDAKSRSNYTGIRHTVVIQLEDPNALYAKPSKKKSPKKNLKVPQSPSENTLKRKNKASESTNKDSCSDDINNSINFNTIKRNKRKQGNKQLIKKNLDSSDEDYKTLKRKKNRINKKKLLRAMDQSIATPPPEFQSSDDSDGVFNTSKVSISTKHNSPKSCAQVFINHKVSSSSDSSPRTKSRKSQPFWYDESESNANYKATIKRNNKKNIGYAIIESYEKELTKKKESLNLPELSMADFGKKANDLELDRKNVIKSMIVKSRKKESWLNGKTSGIDTDSQLQRSSSVSLSSIPRNNVVGRSSFTLLRNEAPNNFIQNIRNNSEVQYPTPQEDTADESDEITFPSFMRNEDDDEIKSCDSDSTFDKVSERSESISEISESISESVKLTIKKLDIDEMLPSPKPYILNSSLTTITPFKKKKIPNKHSKMTPEDCTDAPFSKSKSDTKIRRVSLIGE